MSKHHQAADSAPSGGDNSQGSIWNQLTNGNFNALDLMKEASGYLQTASADYKDLAIINRDERHMQVANENAGKGIEYLGKESRKSLGYAHHEIGEAGYAGNQAAGDTAKGDFKKAAGENKYASNEMKDASRAVDHAISDRTRQNELRAQIAANHERKSADEEAYRLIRSDAKYSSRTGSAELRIANIFHELGLG